MSSERLREAARVLRERVEAATPGPWAAMDYDDNPGDEGVCLLGAADTVIGQHMIGYFHVLSRREQEANADYARTMHPGVGLALANALDSAAEYDPTCDDGGNGEAMFADLRHLADLILGDAS